eukprot:124213-Pleurochrysis_carterae.AAC.1
MLVHARGDEHCPSSPRPMTGTRKGRMWRTASACTVSCLKLGGMRSAPRIARMKAAGKGN